ncbi:transcriptional regulator BetI, partial [Mesorhizobium sp. M7A.F.Ca.AU.002.02.1.1]
LQPGSVSREQAVRQVKNYVAGRLALGELATAGA